MSWIFKGLNFKFNVGFDYILVDKLMLKDTAYSFFVRHFLNPKIPPKFLREDVLETKWSWNFNFSPLSFGKWQAGKE